MNDAADIQAIVLSHGHADHALGLPGLEPAATGAAGWQPWARGFPR